MGSARSQRAHFLPFWSFARLLGLGHAILVVCARRRTGFGVPVWRGSPCTTTPSTSAAARDGTVRFRAWLQRRASETTGMGWIRIILVPFPYLPVRVSGMINKVPEHRGSAPLLG